jgi:hypothetical protein
MPACQSCACQSSLRARVELLSLCSAWCRGSALALTLLQTWRAPMPAQGPPWWSLPQPTMWRPTMAPLCWLEPPAPAWPSLWLASRAGASLMRGPSLWRRSSPLMAGALPMWAAVAGPGATGMEWRQTAAALGPPSSGTMMPECKFWARPQPLPRQRSTASSSCRSCHLAAPSVLAAPLPALLQPPPVMASGRLWSPCALARLGRHRRAQSAQQQRAPAPLLRQRLQ